MRIIAVVLCGAILTTSVSSAQTEPPERLHPLPPPPAAPPDVPPPVPSPDSKPAEDATAAPATDKSAAPESAPAPTSTPAKAPPCTGPKPVHDGFYLGIGTGFGQVGAWGDGPSGSASISGFGTSSSIAIGGTPVRGLATAFVIQGATRAGGTFNGGPQVTATTTTVVNGRTMQTTGPLGGHANASLFLLGAQVDWYPVPEGGWHAGGALGLGGAAVTDDAGNTMSGLSVGASLFGGHQWWLGSSWSLGISAIVTGAPSVKMNDSNQNDTGYRMFPLSVGIESLLLYY
jgi:hypothetical protein